MRPSHDLSSPLNRHMADKEESSHDTSCDLASGNLHKDIIPDSFLHNVPAYSYKVTLTFCMPRTWEKQRDHLGGLGDIILNIPSC